MAPHPRPFANDNQYATSLGGPVIKNKTFFFVNFEGLRFVLPSVVSVTITDRGLRQRGAEQRQESQPAESSAYQSMFNLYANAPGAAGAQTIVGC